jgi:hypothetical protein
MNESAPLELCFVCTSTGEDFLSESWRFVGELRIEEEAGGGRTLKGMVEVSCSLCAKVHAVAIEELACPYRQAEK